MDWSVQANYDHFTRVEVGPRIKNDTFNLDFGARWRASPHHELNVGLTGRLSHDDVQGSSLLFFDKPVATDRWISGYVQDDISLIPNRLRLTLGSKFEYNNFTGFEAQPSAKLFYRISPALAVWGGASRAVLTPSRIERHGQGMLTLSNAGTAQASSGMDETTYVRLEGVRHLKSERLVALELGARAQFDRNWSLDLSVYANHYDRLLTMEPIGFEPIYVPFVPFPVGSIIIANVANNGELDSRGVEVLLTGRLTPFWKVDFNYSEIHFSNMLPVARPPIISNIGMTEIGAANVQPEAQNGGAKLWIFPDYSPKHQVGFRNMLDIGDKISIDTHVRYVASLVNGRVPDYVSLDARLSYRPTETIELSLVGTNLNTKKRQEYLHPLIPVPDSYTPRVVSMQARVRF
nr:TonB-dependent receptor [Aquisediminimonas sediminicola]